MDEKLFRYILREIAHTQAQLLKLKGFSDAVRVNPNLNWDEYQEILGTTNVDFYKNVIGAMKKRADHEGVSLDGLLD